MRNKITWLGVLTATVVADSYFGTLYVRPAILAASPLRMLPFTAKTQEEQFDNDHHRKTVELRTIAVNSAGTQVDILDTLDGNLIGNASLLDLERKVRISIDPATESITTYPYSDLMVATAKQVIASCSDDPRAEHRTLWGYPSFKRIENKITGTMTVSSERWLSPELNCFSLEETVVFYRNGVRVGHKAKHVLSLTMGEPDPSLFLVPAGFTERSPSEVFAELSRRTGKACPRCDASGTALDKAYQSHRQ